MALERAIIRNTVTDELTTVLFNPEEYTINREINYAQTGVPGLSAPIIQFVHGNMQTLEMELLLDTLEDHGGGVPPGGDVRDLLVQITGLMNIEPTTHAPPVLEFVWGSLTFTCVLARSSQRFIMFRPDGVPVRARINVTFNEFRNVDMEAREVRRETADYTKLHVVKQGETLSAIAARAYGDPALWRPIALGNRIDDPRSLMVGLRLHVPPLPFRDPETGEVYDQP
ncbi:MAG TPA: LysM peptidoglycan-binding domain-containing protein [Roseiflexaceae bacterium]